MDYQMESSYDGQNNRWQVTLAGEVDIFNSADLKGRLTTLLSQQSGDLYLYCKNLEYIDSTALGALVAVMKTVKSNGQEMHLVAMRPHLTKLFRITNLDTVFVLDEGDDSDD